MDKLWSVVQPHNTWKYSKKEKLKPTLVYINSNHVLFLKGTIKEWAKNKDKMFTCSYCSGRFVNFVAEGFQQGTCMRNL